jgi:EmrB/QacA subfamily drug resistance transporter
MASTQTPPTVSEEIHRRRWIILGILLISVLVVVLDSSILNVALKTMAEPKPKGLSASQGSLEWAINSYTLIFAGLLFSAGLLGDRFGRKKMLLAGMLIFGVSSLLSALSTNTAELITFRSLMGLGGALITPATLAILMNVFGPAERAKAIGIWSSVVGVAIAAGPIVGGALLQHFWWGSVFLVNVPIAALALVFMFVFVPDSKDPNPGKFDPIGVLLSIVGLVVLIWGVVKGGEFGTFGKPEVWGSIVGGAILIALWVLVEHRSSHPAFDVRYFRNRRFSASVSAIGIMAFGLNGVVFFFIFYTQSVRGYSALQSGLLLLPLAAAQMYFATRARFVVAKLGPRATCAGALTLMTASFLGFLVLGRHTPIWVLEVCFFVMGMAMANLLPPATVMVMTSLPPEKAGSGSAINNVFRQVGGAIGVAVLGSLLSYSYRQGVDGHLTGLSAAARNSADQSIQTTLAIVRDPNLISAADNAFIHAMHVTAIGSAVVSALGVLMALAFMPGKPKPVPADGTPETPEQQKVGAEK